jgi:hypothetical protein
MGPFWKGGWRRWWGGGGSSPGGGQAHPRRESPPRADPDLSIDQVLAWADAHLAARGTWPRRGSGAVLGARGEYWSLVDNALRKGDRGLPGGSSLQRLLVERRRAAPRRLTMDLIVRWAEAHHAATGSWPLVSDGPVAGVPGESWPRINAALVQGCRGLPGGSSLARLFGRTDEHGQGWIRPPLTLEQVLAWGDTHHAATGRWPTRSSGAVTGTPGESWTNIDQALRKGFRRLPAVGSLKQLFAGRAAPGDVSPDAAQDLPGADVDGADDRSESA